MELFQNLNSQGQLGQQAEGKKPQNLQAISLYISNNTFIIEPNQKTFKLQTNLVIERQSGRISEMQQEGQISSGFDKKRSFSAFIGIISILDQAFLLMVDTVVQVCTIEQSDIFQLDILAFIPFIPYENEEQFYNSPKGKDIAYYIGNLKKLLQLGYYFSYTYDLTLSKQKQALHQETDEQYLWNSYMVKDLRQYNVHKNWIIPLIQGYIGWTQAYFLGKSMNYYIISRRSYKRGGTRYNARGIDDEGNVANYGETEQIIYFNRFCCSHVQIRGSVPTFWEQKGLTVQTQITRSYDLTNFAFLKHFEKVKQDYQRVICVNLLARGKKSEQRVTDTYEIHLKNNNLDWVKYEYFDFHHECKGQKFDKVNPLVLKLEEMIENLKFYVEDIKTNQVLMMQKGVVRTNCLDCLDRTNFFMTKVGALMFMKQIDMLGVDLVSAFNGDFLTQLDSTQTNEQPLHAFVQNFKTMWADNGDWISIHYTGTGSTHSNITRTGKRDYFGLIDHGMKTLTRFYNQNFEDNIKQELIDLLLGLHTDTINLFNDNLLKELKSKEKEFTTISEINVFSATWNVHGFLAPNSFDFQTELLNMDDNQEPDLIVLGLQDTYGAETSETKITDAWQTAIYNNLEKFQSKYILLKEKFHCGCLLIIYSKSNLKDRITRVSYDTQKLNLMGSKGAVIIKLYIDDTSICFITCILEQGPKHVNTRILNVTDIHNNAFQLAAVGQRKEEKLESLDYKFLLGDLNFQIDLPNQEIKQFIEGYEKNLKLKKNKQAQEIIEHLMKKDEFAKSARNSDVLAQYSEAQITYLPTSIYDQYSTVYNKDYSPQWGDRIMISCREGYQARQYLYTRREYFDSDHRPVVAYYSIDIKKINHEKKQQIINLLVENQKNLIDEQQIDEDDVEENDN